MADQKIDQNKLWVEVLLPNYYDKSAAFSGSAKSVSGTNSEGNFDILPLHANFVSVVSQKLVIVEENGASREIKFEKGLIEASNNVVKIFVEF